MASTLQRPRGKRLLALAAVVIGGVLLAQRYLVSERVEERELAARAELPEQSKRVEHTALESKPSPSVTPTPSVPSSIGPATTAESLAQGGKGPKAVTPEGANRAAVNPASTLAISSAPLAPKPAVSAQPLQPLAPSKPTPRRVERQAPSVPPSGPLTLATVEPSWGGAASEPTSKKEDDAQQPSLTPPAPSSSSGVGAAAPGATKEPVATDADAPKRPGAPGVVASEARPFASEQAQQQLATAASEASRCASLGSTRGSGKVNVSIATWGRVVRVTHLNQAFVGTPVGVCVMEAFQKVQVPPFDGATQTVAGSFLIQ